MKKIKLILLSCLIIFFNGCQMNEKKENNNFTQISVENFEKELEDENIFLIDVRTPEELPVYGKIRENQKLININDRDEFILKINKLDKNKKYLIYCWHGNRSVYAREFMKKQGFIYVKDLKGGIDEWEKQGKKIIK